MARGHTDPQLQKIADKLQLKPHVHLDHFETCSHFLVNQHKLDGIQTLTSHELASRAASAMLDQKGAEIWPSSASQRSHLTVLSAHGDSREVKTKRTQQYNKEKEEYVYGRREKAPIKPPNKKGLTFLVGRGEVEKPMREYMERLLEMGVVKHEEIG